jgi:hypothetical protein
MVTTGTPTDTPEKASQTSCTTSSSIQTPAADRKVVIAGFEFDYEPTPKTVQQFQVAIYTKAARATMDFKDKTELFERASVKKSQPKFTMMNLQIDDPDKLDDTYNLTSAIEKMKANHIKYDLNDVFNVVFPDDTDFFKIVKIVDLYNDYGSIKASDVAKSNRFYATMLRDPNGSIHENLTVTQEYLINNTDDNLVLKINETYLSYPVEERGGPLFFKLLMDLLQNNSTEAAEYLVNVVKNLKITNFDGENILKVVSLIRGAVKRLTNLKDATGQTALPKDLPNHLLDVFQTLSVEDFNSLFKHFHLQSQIATFRQKKASTPTINEILEFAESQYHLMKSTGKWTGVHAKANETIFLAALQAATNTGQKFTICFNCGGSHSFQNCPKPADQQVRIKANKKLFRDQRKKAKTPSRTPNKGTFKKPAVVGKFSPPTEEEKKNKNQRLIDGKLHYFHFKTKRWNLVKESNSPGPSTTIANPAMATLADNPPGHLTPVISNQTRDLAVANAARQIESTFQGLLSQFSSTI